MNPLITPQKTLSRSGSKLFSFKSAVVAFICLFAFSTIAKAQFRERLYANTQTNNVEAKGTVQVVGINLSLAQALQQLGIHLEDLGTVANPDQAADIDPANAEKTFSTLSATYLTANLGLAKVMVGALVSQTLGFSNVQLGTSPVTVKLGYGGGLAQTLIDGLSVQATLNGNPVGPVFNKTNSIIGLLGNLSVVEATFTPGVPYNGVRVSINSENQLLALNAFYSVNVYQAYVYKDVSTLANCDGPFDLLHQAGGSVSALGGITNPFDAIDNNQNTFAQLNSGANVISTPEQGVSLTSIFPTYSKAGDSAKAIISYPGTLLEAQLLSSIKIQAIDYKEDGTETVVGEATGSTLLHLELLSGSTNKAKISFPVSLPFNRVRIAYGGVAVALQSLNVYEVNRVAPSPLINGVDVATNSVTACAGDPITLSIQNPEVGSTYIWYTSATGGTPITAGVSANGTIFMPQNLAVGANTFYVTVMRPGCGNEASARTKAIVNVKPSPLASDIAIAGGGNYCGGDVVTLTPSVVASPSIAINNPIFKWYRNTDRTGQILTGTSDGTVSYTITASGALQISGLIGTKIFYASVTGGNNSTCESAPGQLQNATIKVNPIATDATIDNSGSLTQCAGVPFEIVPLASTVTNPVFKYYLDANKTQALVSGYTDGIATYVVDAAGKLTIAGVPNGASRTVYLTVSGDNFCENATGKAITVTSASTLLPPTVAANAVDVCGLGNSAVFTVTNHSAGLTYTLYDAAVGGNVVAAAAQADNVITIANISTSASYYIQVTGTGGCVGDTRTKIDVKYLPKAPANAIVSVTVNGKNAGDVCADSNGNFLLTATSTGVTNPKYMLYKGAVFIESNNTGIFNLSGLTPGVSVTYAVGVSGDNYCETDAADRKSITFTPYARPGDPILNLTGVTTVAAGSTLQLKVDPIPANVASFQWSKDGVVLSETSSLLTVNNVTASAAGVYTVIAIGPGGCTSVASASVTIAISGFNTGLTVSTSNPNGKANAGDELTYTLTIANTGTVPLTSVKVTDPLPNHTDFVSASNGGSLVGNDIVFSLPDIGVGQTATVTAKVKVQADLTGVTSITNAATVASDQATKPAGPVSIDIVQNPNFTTNLTVASSNANGKANANDELTYTLTINNTGDQKLTNLNVADPLPANTDFVSASNGGALFGNDIIYNLADLPVGQTTTVTAKVKVQADLTGVTSITNSATVASDQATKPAGPVSIDVVQNPNFTTNLTVASSNANGKANANDELTYTFTVTNTGDQKLTHVKITDPLPANTDFVSASNGGSLVGNDIVFSLADIGVGQTATVTAKVKVKADLTGVTSITNSATVASDQATKPAGPVSIDVVQNPNFTTNLTVASSNANGKANANDELTYTFTVTNTGDQKLTHVKITDPLPANTDFVSASNGGSLVGNDIVFSLADIGVGQTATVTAKVKVKADLSGVTSITNSATVASDQATKPAGPVSIDVVQNPNFTTNLTVASSNANGKANANDELTYTFTVTNTGDQKLTHVKITDPLPANTDFVSASNGGSLVGNDIVFSLADIGVGQTATVTAKVKVKADLTGVTSITNSATVASDQATKPAGPVSIDVVQNPNFTTDLIVASLNANGKANANDELTYTFTVTNTGGQKLTALKITDPLPANTDFVSASNGGALVGSNIVYNLADLPVGQTTTVTAKVKVKGDLTGINSITNAGTVSSDQLTKPAGPVSIAVVQNPGLTANLTVVTSNGNGKANAGDNLTYTLVVTNNGDQNLTNVVVNDPVPAHTDFVSATSGGTLLGNNVVFNLGNLAPGQSTTIGLTVKVRDELRGVLSITNKATVNADQLNKESNEAVIETIRPANEVYVPNAFTPNGDNKNDTFLVFGDGISNLSVSIFNQWGQKIYQGNDITTGWDGTYKGQAQPSGVYVYFIKAKFFDGTEKLKKGTVTLLR